MNINLGFHALYSLFQSKQLENTSRYMLSQYASEILSAMTNIELQQKQNDSSTWQE